MRSFPHFFQPLDILGKLFNEPLFRSFVISLSVNGFSGVETDKFNIFLQNVLVGFVLAQLHYTTKKAASLIFFGMQPFLLFFTAPLFLLLAPTAY